jgi:hypothetical protein
MLLRNLRAFGIKSNRNFAVVIAGELSYKNIFRIVLPHPIHILSTQLCFKDFDGLVFLLLFLFQIPCDFGGGRLVPIIQLVLFKICHG